MGDQRRALDGFQRQRGRSDGAELRHVVEEAVAPIFPRRGGAVGELGHPRQEFRGLAQAPRLRRALLGREGALLRHHLLQVKARCLSHQPRREASTRARKDEGRPLGNLHREIIRDGAGEEQPGGARGMPRGELGRRWAATRHPMRRHALHAERIEQRRGGVRLLRRGASRGQRGAQVARPRQRDDAEAGSRERRAHRRPGVVATRRTVELQHERGFAFAGELHRATRRFHHFRRRVQGIEAR